MKVTDLAIPEELNWADYCDALADEMLLESQAKRMFSRAAPRAQTMVDGTAVPAQRRTAENATPGAH